MAYEKVNWTSTTPINTTNLNKMDNAIEQHFNEVESAINGIIESGSNENGSWVKFDDGTMICNVYMEVTNQAISSKYGNTALYFGTREWTFPQPFINEKVSVSCGAFIWGTGASWGAVNGSNSNNATLMGYDFYPREAGTKCVIEATAIGKWK